MLLVCSLACALFMALAASNARASARGGYAPTIVVRYDRRTAWGARSRTSWSRPPAGRTSLLHLPRGESVAAALRRLRARRGVLWAVPDYLAHSAGGARSPTTAAPAPTAGGWQQLQWNFGGPFGVNAPEAWANVAADGAPGGKGVTVAVLDTGVAYANRGPFRRSPDFSRYEFVGGYDFVRHNPYPNDRNGHGTFVAAAIAEATNNGYGLTGLAFAAHIMPVRVLDTQGEGEASTIAEGVLLRGQPRRPGDQPQPRVLPRRDRLGHPRADRSDPLRAPSRRAGGRGRRQRGARSDRLPGARAGCRSRSAQPPNTAASPPTPTMAPGLTLVAPGGGADADLPGDPNCHPELPSGRDIFQVTFTGSSPRRFGIPSGYEGTSMATPHVSATAALIIASGVLGRHPTPAQITARLRATARKLGGGGDERLYGAGPARRSGCDRPRRSRRRRRVAWAACLASTDTLRAAPPERCDLAVVGGGIVGLAVARELLAATRRRASACSSARARSARTRRATTRA